MAGKLFELVRPKSLNNADYEAYEYLLRWIGTVGEDYLYMFYDAEIQNTIENDIINSLDPLTIEALVTKEGRTITLTADDLSKNDLVIIGQMLSNKYVTRLLKNNTTERYAPDKNSFKYRLLQGRYTIEFTLIMPDATLWK